MLKGITNVFIELAFFAMKHFFLIILLISSYSPLHASQETAQVIEIVSNTEIKTLGPTGRRQQIQLAGIQPIEKNHPINQSGIKRLQSLVLGKTVQLETMPGNQAQVSYGGLNIAARLLEEGLVTIDMDGIQQMRPVEQQQFVSAQERAMQNRRGYWFRYQSRPVQRYHYPQWPSQGLPVPLTNAPVFKP